MPPSVLPAVATASAGQYCAKFDFRAANRTTSEPPGSSVAARKLETNSVQRVATSLMHRPLRARLEAVAGDAGARIVYCAGCSYAEHAVSSEPRARSEERRVGKECRSRWS